MKWAELKQGNVVHNLREPMSFLVVDTAEGNTYLCLDTGEVCLTGKPDVATAIDKDWRVE